MTGPARSNRPLQICDALELASTLRERVAGARTGDSKTQTDALVRQLQQDRIVWAMAPIARGGMGADLTDTARITYQLARTSGSLGLIYAMHSSQAYTLLRHGAGSSYLKALTDRLIADQALVASGTSEKGVGGDIFGSQCIVQEDDDGTLTLSKDSPNISYMDHAAAVLATGMRATSKGGMRQVLVAVETARFSFEPGPDTRMMGMHGILNRPYSFSGRFPPGAVFGQEFPFIAGQTMTPVVHVLWAAMWSGLAAQALEKAKAFLAKSAAAEGAELMHVELSRLVNKHYTMNALVREAALEFGEADPSRRSPLNLAGTARIKRLKIVCSELLEEICMGALSVIGFAAYAETGKYSLAEVIRDALSARVMISNNRLLLADGAIERFIDEAL